MVVVRDKETIDYMEELNAAVMGRAGSHPFYGTRSIRQLILLIAEAAGKDADIVLLNKKDLSISQVIARGKVHVREGKVLIKGTYEK